MAKKSIQARGDQYRAIMEKQGIGEYRILAFQFEKKKPETFHIWLMMDPRRPKYYLFDCWEKYAQVIIPKDDAIAEIITDIATRVGGEKITPIMR